jgi:ribosomal protein L11 methyltransferase
VPWLQLQYRVDRSLADPLGDALEQCGALAVTNENAGEDDYYEVAFPGTPGWQRVLVTGMFDSQVDSLSIRERLKERICPDEGLSCEVTMLQDQDWERAWIDSLKPLRVGDRLWVCPTVYEPPEPGDTNIMLDPGLAFGTGSHATTGMCLDWISTADLAGKVILDYGCGSGILGIAAAMRGTDQVYCVDIDPLAIRATRENADRNGVSSLVLAGLPQEMEEGMFADIVIANILSEVIIGLADSLKEALGDKGTLLLTGILDSQVADVRDRFGSQFEYEVRQREQWCLLIGTIKV